MENDECMIFGTRDGDLATWEAECPPISEKVIVVKEEDNYPF